MNEADRDRTSEQFRYNTSWSVVGGTVLTGEVREGLTTESDVSRFFTDT